MSCKDVLAALMLVAAAASASAEQAPKRLSAGDECALRPGDTFRECDVCPEMVVVPPGTFTMGSPSNEVGR